MLRVVRGTAVKVSQITSSGLLRTGGDSPQLWVTQFWRGKETMDHIQPSHVPFIVIEKDFGKKKLPQLMPLKLALVGGAVRNT